MLNRKFNMQMLKAGNLNAKNESSTAKQLVL